MKEEINEHKCKKWNMFLKKMGPSPISSKPFWQRINSIRTKKTHNKTPKIKINNEIINDKKIIANVFQEKLFKIFNHNVEDELTYNINHKNLIDNFVEQKEYLNNECSSKFIPKIMLKDLIYAIKKTNNKTSMDSFGISNLIIKKLPKSILILIVELFNKC